MKETKFQKNIYENFFITSNGERIWYKYDNFNSEETTVFIHGLGGSSFPMRKFQDLFSKNMKSSIILDLKSHGLSDSSKTINYTIDSFTDDIIELFNFLKIPKLNIVGHCFGGILALKLAAQLPEKIDKLVLISTCHEPNVGLLARIYRGLFCLTDITFSFFPKIYLKRNKEQVNYSKFKKKGDYYLFRLISDWKATSLGSTVKILRNILNSNLTTEAKNIKAETLIIHGKKDRIFSYKKSIKMKSLINQSRLSLRKDDNHVTHVIATDSPLPYEIYHFIYD